MSTKLGQVVLAEEAAKMAEKDQNGRTAKQLPGGERVAGNVA
jgi:hypothetical protein